MKCRQLPMYQCTVRLLFHTCVLWVHIGIQIISVRKCVSMHHCMSFFSNSTWVKKHLWWQKKWIQSYLNYGRCCCSLKRCSKNTMEIQIVESRYDKWLVNICNFYHLVKDLELNAEKSWQCWSYSTSSMSSLVVDTVENLPFILSECRPYKIA